MKMIGLARLARDAELRFTSQGDPVAGFSIAYNYGKKDNGGNQPAQFIQCSLWGKRAESLMPYLLKGKRFLIELDDVHTEEYTGRDGVRGTSLKGRVTNVEFADNFDDKPAADHRPATAAAGPQRNDYAAATGRSMAAQAPAGGSVDDDSGIPF